MQLPVLHQDDHEAKCSHCGVSCHLPVQVGDTFYVIEELRCRFLERAANGRYGCSVYENRFEKAPWCHTALEAAAAGHLAQNCLYAAEIPNYKGREWAPPEVKQKLMPIVRQKLIADGLPISCSPQAALELLAVDGGQWRYSEQKERFVFYRTTPERW